MCSCFTDVTSATIAWDAVRTLLRLMGISNRSSFHQCHTEYMFSFENDPDVETISDASEFLGDTLSIWDIVPEEVRSLLEGFITESTIFFGGYSLSIRSCLCVLNFVVEIIVNHHISISGLFLVLLIPRHVSVSCDHAHGVYILRGNFTIHIHKTRILKLES
jgi:hypothetical protein